MQHLHGPLSAPSVRTRVSCSINATPQRHCFFSCINIVCNYYRIIPCQ
uniref:Uncharacterized protein n=1 Tax=Ascaris lumbricoides TaxID=6252 RepID=A0A0M3IBA2_ASCLU